MSKPWRTLQRIEKGTQTPPAVTAEAKTGRNALPVENAPPHDSTRSVVVLIT